MNSFKRSETRKCYVPSRCLIHLLMLLLRRCTARAGSWVSSSEPISTKRCCVSEVAREIHQKTAVSGKRKAIKYQFVDKARIVATGGKGGNGCISFEGPSVTKRKPSGGSGGAGGRVFAVADQALESLNFSEHHFNGQAGAPGSGSGRKGRRGKDVYIHVPCGTLVSEVVKEDEELSFGEWSAYEADEEELDVDDRSTIGDEYESEEESDDFLGEDREEEGADEPGPRLVTDLAQHGDTVMLANGGKPGLGNIVVASRRVGTKLPGERGESRHYVLELRTIADIGLVGYPNAGKSTLLGRITKAKPKVAMYPFTTLNPVVGKVQYSDTVCLRVADIPGLIDGAHENRGLGHEFLRHVARTRVLVFVVDVAGSEGRSPVQDFLSLREELELYDSDLTLRPAFVVANKIDLPGAEKLVENLRHVAQPFPVLPISALESRGLLDVVVKMREVLEATRRSDDENESKLDAK